MPRHLVAPGEEQIYFQAEPEDSDSDRSAAVPVRFSLIPHLNSLRVSAADAASALPLDGVLIEIRDSFGPVSPLPVVLTTLDRREIRDRIRSKPWKVYAGFLKTYSSSLTPVTYTSCATVTGRS